MVGAELQEERKEKQEKPTARAVPVQPVLREVDARAVSAERCLSASSLHDESQ